MRDDGCVRCPVGAECTDLGLTVPVQPQGIFLKQVGDDWEAMQCAPYAVNSCPRTEDPAVATSKCAAGRDPESRVCALCLDGYFQDGDECAKCSGSASGLPVFLSMIMWFLTLLGTYYFCNSPVTQAASTLLTTSVGLGMMLTGFQALSVMANFSVEWGSPFVEVLNVMKLLVFDVELLQVECVYPSTAISRYTMRILIPLITVVAYVGCYVVSKTLLPMIKKPSWEFPKTVNSAGQIWNAMYITITMTAFLPFQCYSHPNGQSSLLKFPDVLCWEEDYSMWLTLGVIFTLFYGVGFFTLCAVANWKAPSASHDIPRFTMFFRFLLFRFRTDRWYWGTVLMTRSLCMSLVPIVGSNNGNLQLLLFTMTLGTFLPAQCYVMPWKTALLNYADSITMLVLLYVVGGANSFVGKAEDGEPYSIFMLVVFTFGFGMLAIVIARAATMIRSSASKKSPVKLVGNDQVAEIALLLPTVVHVLSQYSNADLVTVLKTFGEYDLGTVRTFCGLLSHELKLKSSGPSARMSRRISTGGIAALPAKVGPHAPSQESPAPPPVVEVQAPVGAVMDDDSSGEKKPTVEEF